MKIISPRKKDIDPGLFCFILVSFLAIPVTILRSRTFEIGYELATLKENEKTLKRKNFELKVQLASIKKDVRDMLTATNKYSLTYPNFYEVEFYDKNNKDLFSINKRQINSKNKL